MPVSSAPLVQPKTKARPNLVVFVLATLGSILFAPIWIIGARYTIDGAVGAVNFVYRFLESPTVYQVGWAIYQHPEFWVIPLAFSVTEWLAPPFRRVNKQWQFNNPWLILVWCVAAALDLATTGYGLLTSPVTIPIVRDLVQSSVGLGITCLVFTFGPELVWGKLRDLAWKEAKIAFTYAFAGA